MLAPADANTDMATNVDVNGAEPQQHTAVPITTTAVRPSPKWPAIQPGKATDAGRPVLLH